jgi:hypothetical protein
VRYVSLEGVREGGREGFVSEGGRNEWRRV